MQKQIVFNRKNAELYMISPYTRTIYLNENRVVIQHIDSKQYIVLYSEDKDVLSELMYKLSIGISSSELQKHLYNSTEIDIEEWINNCVKKGVLE